MNYRRCKLDASDGVQSLDLSSLWLIKEAFASVLKPVMMNDMKGWNKTPPPAEGQAILSVDVHLKDVLD